MITDNKWCNPHCSKITRNELNFSILPFIKRCIYSEVKSYSHIFEIHRGLFRFICIVFLHMRSQCCGVPKSLRTDLAFVRCFSSVSPHVFSQINSGSEIIFTDGTLERFFAGVDSMMDFQEMFSLGFTIFRMYKVSSSYFSARKI